MQYMYVADQGHAGGGGGGGGGSYLQRSKEGHSHVD